MTRETLKEYYMSIVGADEPANRWKPEIICEQIDMFFDNFESRTCDNCIHWNNSLMCNELQIRTFDNFGCNIFKEKETKWLYQ